MADEEPRRDVSRPAKMNSNHEVNEIARREPTPGTSLAAAVRHNRRELSTGVGAFVLNGVRDLTDTSAKNQRSTTTADCEAASSSRAYKLELKRPRQHEENGDASEPMAKRNMSSKVQVGPVAASLGERDRFATMSASQGVRQPVIGSDNVGETAESDMQSRHGTATLPTDTRTFDSSHDLDIAGEGQPEESLGSARYWLADNRDLGVNSLASTQGFSWPGLDEIDLLAESGSPLRASADPTGMAGVNSSTNAGSASIENHQILTESDNTGSVIGSQTNLVLAHEGSVGSLISPEEHFDDFPELNDEDLALIDALSKPRSTLERDIANTTCAVGLNDATSTETIGIGPGGWSTHAGAQQERGRHNPGQSETKFDDFPELTDEDLALIDALSKPRSTLGRDGANTTCAVGLDDVTATETVAVAPGGWPIHAGVQQEGGRHDTGPSKTNLDDFPELTDEDLARIDAISEPRSRRVPSEQNAGLHTIVSETNVGRTGPVAPESRTHRLADRSMGRSVNDLDTQRGARIFESRQRERHGL